MNVQAVVVLKVGAEGGDVTLVGRKSTDEAWQFARATEDQMEALFGEDGEAISAESAWVETWEAALKLMDRYRWAMLYPVKIHAEFVDRVKVAVKERLVNEEASRHVEWVKGKWERVLRERRDG